MWAATMVHTIVGEGKNMFIPMEKLRLSAVAGVIGIATFCGCERRTSTTQTSSTGQESAQPAQSPNNGISSQGQGATAGSATPAGAMVDRSTAGQSTSAGNTPAATPSSADSTSAGATASPTTQSSDKSAMTGQPMANPTMDQDDAAQTAAGQQQGPLSAQDFVNQAASGGMLEVQSSKVALSQLRDPSVQNFAQMMVDDHQKANDELKQIAQKKGLSVPSDLQGQQRQMLDQLQGLPAGQLGAQFAQIQVQAHHKTIELFQRAVRDLQDPDLKEFAQKTLPTLQKHLDQAKQLPQ